MKRAVVIHIVYYREPTRDPASYSRSLYTDLFMLSFGAEKLFFSVLDVDGNKNLGYIYNFNYRVEMRCMLMHHNYY